MKRYWVQWFDLALGDVRSYEPTLNAGDARITFEEVVARAPGRCGWVRLVADGIVIDEWTAPAREEAA